MHTTNFRDMSDPLPRFSACAPLCGRMLGLWVFRFALFRLFLGIPVRAWECFGTSGVALFSLVLGIRSSGALFAGFTIGVCPPVL